ncbi:hypothetical protein HPB48_004251 [Haemaphysalis longicornis]|uniref:Ig-like domain-containing protein n=1 Tax=Haemaphysalis longicornis TaxID=44386 RepID=A0A9J6FXF6_HAELO|nr:hypothetical protein HPB48_004251 [Haemaphysalis longicornis]
MVVIGIFLCSSCADEPRVHVVGVLGERAALPCDMTPNTTDDEVSLVLWYKDDSTTPIYSCDARRSRLSEAHHAPADRLGHRAFLRLGPTSEDEGGGQQGALELYPVHEDDEGLYRCRIDFRKARTRNYEVMLKVIRECAVYGVRCFFGACEKWRQRSHFIGSNHCNYISFVQPLKNMPCDS